MWAPPYSGIEVGVSSLVHCVRDGISSFISSYTLSLNWWWQVFLSCLSCSYCIGSVVIIWVKFCFCQTAWLCRGKFGNFPGLEVMMIMARLGEDQYSQQCLFFLHRCSRFQSEIKRLKISSPVRVCQNCFYNLQHERGSEEGPRNWCGSWQTETPSSPTVTPRTSESIVKWLAGIGILSVYT